MVCFHLFPFDLTFILNVYWILKPFVFCSANLAPVLSFMFVEKGKLFGSQRKLTTFDKDVKIQVKYVHIWGIINFLMLRFAFLSSYL